ncbi:hypothetical protein XELAEV_18010575mg [Xenopus laevis]|uniref:Adhesion G-protein coupled receptor D1 n=1 Tax=Xenopus laevis TaxID=8355 RepID=A0A974I1N2_XENLA|nr:hypothetical protein XELAEV_18010575mg [Xenopus laevis]
MTPGEQIFCSKLRNIALKKACPCAKFADIKDYTEVLLCIVSMEWSLQFWMVILCLNLCGSQAPKNNSWFQDQPGFKVLTSASHYWPLEVVNGILQLHHNSEDIRAVAIHNVTVLHSHNSSSVHINDSAYSNFSATVDIVEGTVNQGIYLNEHLNESNGFSLLYFGSHKNSCISNPSICGPSGVTFSFFWKIQDQKDNSQDPHQNRKQAHASGKKVTSSGFEVFSNEKEGYVVVYNHNKSLIWKAKINPPGLHWTHVLFTWTSNDGLKIYVNGTLSYSDLSGQEFHSYGDANGSLVVGTDSSKHYINCAFDEFIIWERALNPSDIHFYFLAATGTLFWVSSINTTIHGLCLSLFHVSTDAYYSTLINLNQDGRSIRHSKPALDLLQNVTWALPKKSLSKDTAGKLTEAFLKTVGEVLMPAGTDDSTDYSMVKVPQALSLRHYRFPSQGQSYISVPGEAFQGKSRTTIVGLLYHTMHYLYKWIKPGDTRISGAEQYKDHLIAASYIISLKVEPPPNLSANLSGSPLITIQLTHILTITSLLNQVTFKKSLQYHLGSGLTITLYNIKQ